MMQQHLTRTRLRLILHWGPGYPIIVTFCGYVNKLKVNETPSRMFLSWEKTKI